MERKQVPAKILIVDDEGDMLLLMQRILSEREDYEVTMAKDPFEVRQLLLTNDFDLVITDLQMPGFDGFQVLDAVKQRSVDTTVIIMTAGGSVKLLAEAIRRGADACIIKPFRKETVLQMVEQALTSSLHKAG
jgi:DNA-binding NtrC family response regulator